jgi:integrase
MQLGSLLRSSRRRGPDVWEFRYRERPHNGRQIYRRIKVGTVTEFRTEASVRKGITGLIREINFGDLRVQATTMTVAELVEHYRQRELASDSTWKSYSTNRGYESYLKKWIVPHWGNYKLPDVKTIEVETWLRTLSLAKSSSAKIRNILSVLFNHACRYDLFDRNLITLVRHSAKRRRIPDVLTVDIGDELGRGAEEEVVQGRGVACSIADDIDSSRHAYSVSISDLSFVLCTLPSAR